MVARRSREGKPLAAHRFDRSTCREQGGLERCLRAKRVRVDHSARRPDALDELGRVTPQDIFFGRGCALDEVESFVQRLDPRL
jgi:hypothetical protein